LGQDPEEWLQGDAAADAISAEAIETLIQERVDAKANRNFARADEIRDSLLAEGVVLEDSREGTQWKRG
jgi:cysteinyl-tRNA synthetase